MENMLGILEVFHLNTKNKNQRSKFFGYVNHECISEDIFGTLEVSSSLSPANIKAKLNDNSWSQRKATCDSGHLRVMPLLGLGGELRLELRLCALLRELSQQHRGVGARRQHELQLQSQERQLFLSLAGTATTADLTCSGQISDCSPFNPAAGTIPSIAIVLEIAFSRVVWQILRIFNFIVTLVRGSLLPALLRSRPCPNLAAEGVDLGLHQLFVRVAIPQQLPGKPFRKLPN